MSLTWALEVDQLEPERTRADLVVAFGFEGERPLRGAVSRLDWRMSGHLSALSERGVFTGAEGEVILLPAGPRLRAPRALIVGVGPRVSLKAAQLRRAACVAAERAAALRAGVVAIALPDPEASGLAVEKEVGACVIGAGETLAEHPFPLRLRLLVGAEDAWIRGRRALQELSARIEIPGVQLRIEEPSVPPEREQEARPPARAATSARAGSRAPQSPRR